MSNETVITFSRENVEGRNEYALRKSQVTMQRLSLMFKVRNYFFFWDNPLLVFSKIDIHYSQFKIGKSSSDLTVYFAMHIFVMR